MSFWCHFGVILVSFWCHFGVFLVSFLGLFGSFWRSFLDHFRIIFGSEMGGGGKVLEYSSGWRGEEWGGAGVYLAGDKGALILSR